MLLGAALFFTIVPFTFGLENLGCPVEWVAYKLHCYQFNLIPLVAYETASAKCQENGAELVRIGNIDEHNFIKSQWEILYTDSSVSWTGGQRDPIENIIFKWLPGNMRVQDSLDYWLSEDEKTKPGNQLVYKKNGNDFGWSVAKKNDVHSYICEISQDETYRILEKDTGLDYGVEVRNKNNIKRGPIMKMEPNNTVFVLDVDESVVLECLATGNPQVKYKWYKGSQELSSTVNNRYTVTNGRLSITNPQASDSATDYRCEASNEFGSIYSTNAQLTAGSLGYFSNIKPEKELATDFNYKILQCPKIQGKPGLRYQWTKDSVTNYIKTERQQYMFISNNGRLYFSEIGGPDAGKYYCMVTLSGSGHLQLTSDQAPSRISKEIELEVKTGSSKANFGPEILNEFIAVFPSLPMIGDEIRMECFAYGTFSSPFIYKWEKIDGEISSRATLSDLNRVLTIKNAQRQDEGTYNCIVNSNAHGSKSDSKNYTLQLQSKPYFVIELKSQLIEPGARFTWRCMAEGRPAVTYSWLKDTKKLVSGGNIQINTNMLTILRTDEKRDNGMYQCTAENSNGITYSTAQLKIASFAPKFIQYHLPSSTLAARTGKVSLRCHPDAIPKATISWSRNGADLGLDSSQSTGRIQKLLNGNLFIQDITQSDAGEYKCTATNNQGEASQSTKLRVVENLVISRRPSNIEVIVNETAFFYCGASYNPDFEIVYKWYFNGYPINVEKDAFYSEGTVENQRGLYIRTAQLKHKGNYTCLIESPLATDAASAFLTVKAPPSEPAGVYGDGTTEDKITIHWLAPNDNGFPITRYIIESSNKLNPVWKMASREIPSSAVEVQDRLFKTVEVLGLQPNNQYKFRVRAINKLGVGQPSLPSADYRTLSSPPKRAPNDVGGGGGKVGDLSITWAPLPPEEQCADGIGYVVYWRVKGNPNSKWSKHVMKGQAKEYYALAGLNYYTLYEVKVQAFNEKGLGPNSTISSIYSAEDLPRAVPVDVFADTYNATALIITWTPPVNDRPTMRGKILGYQINWENRDVDDPIRYSQSFYGEISEAIIIGLFPNGYYWVTVQVFNTAGLGPLSEKYLGSTGMDAPLNFPTEVTVYSRDSSSVEVKFRGIGFGIDESPVTGYKLCYRSVREVWDLDNCKDIGFVEGGVLGDLEKDTLYKLRVLAWSGDGDGKKSEAIYFTLGGQVVFDPSSYSLLAESNRLSSSISILILCFLCIITWIY
ncbi:contactin-2 isoform X1 [Octopus sinensis]|uniref:Contactin-2 isoform X1 n=1 Tax=Octopus sinensis TaxID=2607531 RepID=A0A6P7T802_9MOLL|nr:contactin-2 isoform X1 [Octopus sinensis]